MAQSKSGIEPVQAVNGDRAVSAGLQSEVLGTPWSTDESRQDEGETRSAAEAAVRSAGAEVAEALRAQLEATRTELCFEKDETSGKMVVRLKDATTGEIVRQIPPDEMLKIAQSIDRYLGLLVDRRS